LKILNHPNVVRYYDSEWVRVDQAVKIYTEYLKDWNLEAYTSHMRNRWVAPPINTIVPRHLVQADMYSGTSDWPSELDAWSFICQISAALAYCHTGLIREEAAAPRKPRFFKEQAWNQVLHRDVKPLNGILCRLFEF
jgi:serine/threonine protein kinase